MTYETEIARPARPAVSFDTALVRIKNVLLQGVLDLARPEAAERGKSLECIEISEQGMSLVLANGDPSVPLSPQILAGFAGRARQRPVDLVFRGGSCIDLAFSVPTAPLTELRQLVESEVRFRSPFSDAVALSFWTAREGKDGRWQVQAAVLLKSRVGQLLTDLQVNRVPIGRVWREEGSLSYAAHADWAGGAQPVLDPWAVLKGVPSALKMVLAGSVMLLTSAMLLTLSLGLQAGGLASDAEAARASLSAEAQTSANLRSLEESLTRSGGRLAMTGRLSGLMPDGFWLEQLEITQDSVTLTGFGPSAAEVTRLLSTMPELTDIIFASPVTRDNTQALERYRISANFGGVAQ